MSAVAAAVVAGGAVVGAVIQSDAASHAADLQARSAQNAQNIQQGMYNQTVQNEQPYMQAGQGAGSQLNYLLGTSGTPRNAPNWNNSARRCWGPHTALFPAHFENTFAPRHVPKPHSPPA